MSNQSKTNTPEQTHDAMQAASHRPLTGAPDVQNSPPLAAGGGLEVPGREMHAASIPMIGIDHAHHEPIPGERDGDTLTHRQPGAMSTSPFNGQEPSGATWPLDDARRRELAREGGGLDAEQRQRQQDKKKGDR